MRPKLILTVGVVACAAVILAAIGVRSPSASPGRHPGRTLVVV
jgi:hypothetical protein